VPGYRRKVIGGMSFEWFIARRYLKIKHQRKLVPMITILSTFGVALGVMVLVVVIAVMTGFQSELKSRILGIEAHMVVMRYNEWISGYQQVIRQIDHVPGVQSVAPFVYAQGILRSARGVRGVVLRGIDSKNSTVHVPVQKGKSLSRLLSEDHGSPGIRIVIGTVLADKLGVKTGDGIMLMVAGARSSSLRQLPQMHRLVVSGLFETGMYQYDGAMGFMPMDQLQKLIGVGDLVTGLNVRLENADAVDSVSEVILNRLGVHYWISDWKQMHRNLFSMLELQKLVMYVILTLIIVVAAFNVASALIMMVREKTKEIAILKAMGATHRSLQNIFLGKGIVIGLLGIGIGLAAGLGVCGLLARYHFVELPGDVYFLTTLPVKISFRDMGIITLGTLIICTCASWYPAKQAARLNPVDAIRYG
jgi:lipoprotein-releasing system permease protein